MPLERYGSTGALQEPNLTQKCNVEERLVGPRQLPGNLLAGWCAITFSRHAYY